MWMRTEEEGKELLSLLSVTENRWNTIPCGWCPWTRARIAGGCPASDPKNPLGVLDAGGRAQRLLTRPVWTCREGGRRGLQPFLPELTRGINHASPLTATE